MTAYAAVLDHPRASAARDTGLRVTYVVSRWGEPTQTFVRREAASLVDAGAQVRIRSLKRPIPCRPPLPFVYLRPGRVAWAAVRTMFRHPGAATRAVGTVVWRSAPRNVPSQFAAAVIGLAWAAEPDDADLVHAHFGWVSATAAWAMTRITGQPYSVVLHAFELHSKRYQDRFAGVPLRAAAQVFTISSRDADLVGRKWDLDASVLRMGVSDEWLRTGTRTSRDPRLVVSVGSLVPKKGHAVLLDALARAGHELRLVIVGDGPERPSLSTRAANLGLGGRLEFLGTQTEVEVRRLLDRASVFALACIVGDDGDRDGIPVAIVEAMARHVPVVTTDIGGIPELVEDAALVVPAGNAAALAVALDRCIAGGEAVAEMVHRARARVESDFRSGVNSASVLELAAGLRGR